MSLANVVKGILVGAVALVWVFGGLLIWPWYRQRHPSHKRRLVLLRSGFVLHVMGLIASAVIATWAHVTRQPDAYGYALLFYLTGTASLLLSALVIGFGAAAERVGTR